MDKKLFHTYCRQPLASVGNFASRLIWQRKKKSLDFYRFKLQYGRMDFHTINPGHFRVAMLLKMGNEDIHELACRAVAVLTTYRLVIGRCLEALHQSRGYLSHGCSTAVHYACAVLGMTAPTARECRRVAKALQRLPQLTEAAELGTIEWSKLREIVRRASPATELYWLRLAQRHSYREIEVLVGRTPKGSIPGEVDHDGDYRSELRCAAGPNLFAMIDRMRRVISIEKEEAVTTAEVLELALTSLMTKQPFDPEAVEKARQDADKDVQAQKARLLPVVFEARELAAEMGLLEVGEGAELESHEDVGSQGGEESGVWADMGAHYRNNEAAENEADVEANEGLGEGAPATPEIAMPEIATPGNESAVAFAATQQSGLSIEKHPTKNSEYSARNILHGESGTSGTSGPVGRAAQSAGNGPIESPAQSPAENLAESPAQTLAQTLADGPAAQHAPKSHSRIIAEALHHARHQATESWRNHQLRYNPLNRSRGLGKSQREETLRRDGWACRTPGCPNNVWLHLHHMHEYSKGGFTHPDNLICLCAGCHRNVHRGHLRILELPDGGVLYTNSEGKPLDRQADLTLATWLDFHLGWSGREFDSHQARLWKGEWSVFSG